MRAEKIWIVYKQWPTGKIERVAAYFSEEKARWEAGLLVGKDAALIGLETIDVKDDPPPLGYPSITQDVEKPVN